MNNFKESYWKYSLVIILLVMLVVITRRLMPFLGGLLGALTVYILVRRQMFHITDRWHLRRSLGALLVTGEVVLVFLLPLSLIVWMLVAQLQDINVDPDTFAASVQQTAALIEEKTGFDVWGKESQAFLMKWVPHVMQIIMSWISGLVVNLGVMVLVLYFMIVGGRNMEQYLRVLLPFNKENTTDVLNKIHLIVRSNALGIPLLALIQGSVATVGYFLFDASSPLLLGLLTCFVTVIPIVGTALVWVPASAYLALQGDWVNAAALFLYGAAVVSQLDSLIRFILQKQMANIHPLITIFGVIIGLQLFGFMGIIFGPLLLSLFCLFVDIFKKEYLEPRPPHAEK